MFIFFFFVKYSVLLTSQSHLYKVHLYYLASLIFFFGVSHYKNGEYLKLAIFSLFDSYECMISQKKYKSLHFHSTVCLSGVQYVKLIMHYINTPMWLYVLIHGFNDIFSEEKLVIFSSFLIQHSFWVLMSVQKLIWSKIRKIKFIPVNPFSQYKIRCWMNGPVNVMRNLGKSSKIALTGLCNKMCYFMSVKMTIWRKNADIYPLLSKHRLWVLVKTASVRQF